MLASFLRRRVRHCAMTPLVGLFFTAAFLAIVPASSAQVLDRPTQGSSVAQTGPQFALADTARVRRWSDDLDFIVARVRSTHPRPFAIASAAAFDSASHAIGRSIATTGDARLAVECMRMVALLGDGHTMVVGTFPPLGFTSVLPIFLRPFEDGLYLAAADPAYASAVGNRVTRVGDVTAEEALARVGAATSGDNRYTRLDRAPLFLMIPAMLQALGISSEHDAIALEIERTPGKRERVVVSGGAPPAGFPEQYLATEPRFPAEWKSARAAFGDRLPRCDWRPEDAWWFEYLPQSRLLYLRLSRIDPIVAQRPNPESYRRFYQRLFAAIDSLKPAALAVDLRHDHGGNNMILDPLIRGIVERPWLNREGGLFALIDRGTFSAAMNAAVFLENQSSVMFVGEPTGGRVNHYGDALESQTPNLGMMMKVSTLPWLSRYPQDDRPWIAPELAAPVTFADWREGRDAGLEAVLDAVQNGTRDQRMIAASRQGGPAAAAAAFSEWTKRHPNPWGANSAATLATSMTRCMDRGAWADAVALGEALVRMEPKVALGWRVLGEAQLDAGNRARGVECLRETLRLNPQARAARMILRQLGEEP